MYTSFSDFYFLYKCIYFIHFSQIGINQMLAFKSNFSSYLRLLDGKWSSISCNIAYVLLILESILIFFLYYTSLLSYSSYIKELHSYFL